MRFLENTFDRQTISYQLYNLLESGLYEEISKNKLIVWLILRGLNGHFLAFKWSVSPHKTTFDCKNMGLKGNPIVHLIFTYLSDLSGTHNVSI